MLTLSCTMAELRGISNQVNNKTGQVYYLVNVEDSDGNPFQFYTRDPSVFEQGLKRGDIVDLYFTYRIYKGDTILSLFKVVKSK